MGKSRQLSPKLWPLIDVILFSYIELIFRGGVSCLPAALLFSVAIDQLVFRLAGNKDMHNILDDCEFMPDWSTDNRSSCSSMSKIYPNRLTCNGKNGDSTFY